MKTIMINLNFQQPLWVLIIGSCVLFMVIINTNRGAVRATSINYGIIQQPITDINQLMPKLCQNQSVICEGSFCIPGVKKCVCDLRMPVQFDRFCLRQVDIETSCFVTSQCNHTIKDAVCIDSSSNTILDRESSKFKLEQWQQLHDFKKTSSQQPKDLSLADKQITGQSIGTRKLQKIFDDTILDKLKLPQNVIFSNARNSPYEINYTTDLQQNLTRRKNVFSGERPFFLSTTASPNLQGSKRTHVSEETNANSTDFSNPSSTTTLSTTTRSHSTTVRSIQINTGTSSTVELSTVRGKTETVSYGDVTTFRDIMVTTPLSTSTQSDVTFRKKIAKPSKWPPGVCSCPFGFMFDSMLRKCLAISLSDSHCLIDSDCRQIQMAHCSTETKRCVCDEPLVWNRKDLACVRPTAESTTTIASEDSEGTKETEGLVENLLPPLVLAKLIPDYKFLLLIFIFIVIIITLVLLKVTVKCFSPSNSALISPKNRKKKSANHSDLTPKSPYATLRRPEHKPSSQLSDFTQTTRGRILNYDFEQESPKITNGSSAQSPLLDSYDTSATLSKNFKLKTNNQNQRAKNSKDIITGIEDTGDKLSGFNDTISLSQLEADSKSENSIVAIPGPTPNHQPPYMLAMRGQSSAIAAAAAAVANKRIQMAQKKSLEQQQQNSVKLANGSPVFL